MSLLHAYNQTLTFDTGAVARAAAYGPGGRLGGAIAGAKGFQKRLAGAANSKINAVGDAAKAQVKKMQKMAVDRAKSIIKKFLGTIKKLPTIPYLLAQCAMRMLWGTKAMLKYLMKTFLGSIGSMIKKMIVMFIEKVIDGIANMIMGGIDKLSGGAKKLVHVASGDAAREAQASAKQSIANAKGRVNSVVGAVNTARKLRASSMLEQTPEELAGNWSRFRSAQDGETTDIVQMPVRRPAGLEDADVEFLESTERERILPTVPAIPKLSGKLPGKPTLPSAESIARGMAPVFITSILSKIQIFPEAMTKCDKKHVEKEEAKQAASNEVTKAENEKADKKEAEKVAKKD